MPMTVGIPFLILSSRPDLALYLPVGDHNEVPRLLIHRPMVPSRSVNSVSDEMEGQRIFGREVTGHPASMTL